MIRKVLRFQYSDTKIEGKFIFRVNNNEFKVQITSSYVENNLILNISLTFWERINGGPCYKIEILNAKDETVFFFIHVDQILYGNWTVDIPSLCNITALKKRNSDLVSGNSEDPVTSPPHIKMAVTFGTKDELVPLSSATNIHKLSSIPMLRSILNETVFDDPQIEAEAIAKLTELSLDNLRSVIKVENAASILQFAKKYNVESLKEVAVKFVADNFREVMETSGWKEMPDHLSKELLSTILLSLTPRKNVDAAEQD